MEVHSAPHAAGDFATARWISKADQKESERERALARAVEASHLRFEGQQVRGRATDAAQSGQVNRENTIFSTETGVGSWGTCAASAKEKHTFVPFNKLGRGTLLKSPPFETFVFPVCFFRLC